jgi:hypothetical protein
MKVTMSTKTTFYSCLSAMSLMFCLSAQPALGFVSVSVSPGSQVAFVGSNVVFNAQVNATAGETITGYTWLTSPNGQNPFTIVPGATTPTCTLVTVQTNQTGSYFVKVTYNSGGSIGLTSVSSAVTLVVVDQARITAQPQGGLIRIVGDSASFSVSALGFPTPGYQWRFNGMNLTDDARISGANTTNLTLTSLVTADTGSYDVVVTNAYSSVTSQVATLSVFLPPSISAQPQSTNVIIGSDAVFSVTASGSAPLSYQWQRSGTNLSDGGRITGATNALLTIATTITSDSSGYTVVISNTSGSVTSSVATLTVLSPVSITSVSNASGKQGVSFSFTTTASGTLPIALGASGLPAGLSFDPATGVIAGMPIFSGTFLVSIGATNLVNSDSQVLTLTITSSVPMITSATSATGTENQGGFSYTIRATDSPILFGASALPLGLSVDTTSGAITGTPLFAGTFTVSIWAINAWGTGSTNLVLNISPAPIGGLAITDVTATWAKPYLLDFTFSLRDGTDPSTSSAVVVPASQLQVVCMEDGVPISSENPYILESASALNSTNQLKTLLVLDYTYSMFAVPGAIDAMQAAAELLINEEPAHAQFGIWEFHADYANPQSVTTNAFLKDKAALIADIEGIQTNYVKGNYAGTRCWDAMYAALKQFGPTNGVQQRYLVAMTDGNDDSSLLNTNADPVATLISLAQTNQVQIFCVAFGNDVNTNALLQLTSQTGGHYYLAAETTNLATQFQMITKDISSQYVLRWATLRRTAQPFQPSFQVTYGGFTDTFNTNLIYQTNEMYLTNITVDTSQTPPVTNIDITTNLVVTNIVSLPFNPPTWSNDVRVGSLLLAQDVDLGPQTIRLQAFYVPRYIREIQIFYRPNYPCTAALASTGTNEILYGWSMTETTDTNGLRTLTMMSPDPTNQLASIQYAAFGDLVEFDFNYPDALTATQAFSVFSIDNSIYTNMPPNGMSFTNQNFPSFIKLYPPAPPHGTPIPWLIYYGFTTNFADAELITTNGLPVWQDYVAGLNPTNANSSFSVSIPFAPGQAPQIIFSTVAGRKYRVETATSLDSWAVLRDNIPGTGGNILFVDDRVLSGVNPVFYRVAVY